MPSHKYPQIYVYVDDGWWSSVGHHLLDSNETLGDTAPRALQPGDSWRRPARLAKFCAIAQGHWICFLLVFQRAVPQNKCCWKTCCLLVIKRGNGEKTTFLDNFWEMVGGSAPLGVTPTSRTARFDCRTLPSTASSETKLSLAGFSTNL